MCTLGGGRAVVLFCAAFRGRVLRESCTWFRDMMRRPSALVVEAEAARLWPESG